MFASFFLPQPSKMPIQATKDSHQQLSEKPHSTQQKYGALSMGRHHKELLNQICLHYLQTLACELDPGFGNTSLRDAYCFVDVPLHF